MLSLALDCLASTVGATSNCVKLVLMTCSRQREIQKAYIFRHTHTTAEGLRSATDAHELFCLSEQMTNRQLEKRLPLTFRRWPLKLDSTRTVGTVSELD